MKEKRIALVVSVFMIFIASIGVMNYNYDILSRYPYRDENSRKLIKQYLNDEEIDYIIEYSIAPSLFVNYIQEKNFNIYHAKEYFDLGQSQWQKTSTEIVNMVEETRNYYSVEELNNYLIHYSYPEIYYWLYNKDLYNQNSILVDNAGDISAYLDDTYSVGIRTPFNLEDLSSNVPSKKNTNILVDVALQKPLENLCEAIKQDLESNKACGGLYIESGYISYQQQKSLYDEAVQEYGNLATFYEPAPGHSEHQLGLAIDFGLSIKTDVTFSESDQYLWLYDNAHKYGFVETYNNKKAGLYNKVAKENHFRYLGIDLATYLYNNNLSLKEALKK